MDGHELAELAMRDRPELKLLQLFGRATPARRPLESRYVRGTRQHHAPAHRHLLNKTKPAADRFRAG
jgi:hypothetical protein